MRNSLGSPFITLTCKTELNRNLKKKKFILNISRTEKVQNKKKKRSERRSYGRISSNLWICKKTKKKEKFILLKSRSRRRSCISRKQGRWLGERGGSLLNGLPRGCSRPTELLPSWISYTSTPTGRVTGVSSAHNFIHDLYLVDLFIGTFTSEVEEMGVDWFL